MAGLSRSKNGVASLAYVPAIHALLSLHGHEDVDARRRGHDDGETYTFLNGHAVPSPTWARWRR